VLFASDYDSWLLEERPNCNTRWAYLNSFDLNQNLTYWIEVGLHKLNKIFFLFGTGFGKTETLLRLELFEITTEFSKEGKILIGAEKGKPNTHNLEASVFIEKGIPVRAELSVQTATDKKPFIRTVEIVKGDEKYSAGEIKDVQEGGYFSDKKYTVKAPTRSGKDIALLTPEPTNWKTFIFQNDNIEITLLNEIEAVQSSLYSGTFNNLFHANLSVLNKTKNKILFTKLTAEYKDKTGTYQPFNWVFSGRKSGYYNYSLQEFKNVTIEPETKTEFVLAGSQKITSKQYTNHRRSHQATFPDPLDLRFVLTDMTNNTITLDLKYANPALELVKRKKKKGNFRFLLVAM